MKNLEAIFTDTKESALQNIRNFFRQKFADEEKDNLNIQRTESSQIRGRPLLRPKDNSDERNKPKSVEKNAQGTDKISRHFEDEGSLEDDTEMQKIPFMRSIQSQESNGYHTRVRLQLDGCCNE